MPFSRTEPTCQPLSESSQVPALCRLRRNLTRAKLGGVLVELLLMLVMGGAGVYRHVSTRAEVTADAAVHPWEFETTNGREQAHLEAADFLAELNFYENGHGLVIPPSLTLERLEASVGVEGFAEMSGLIHNEGKFYGLREEKLGSTKLLVAGCAACHVGKAAGRIIPGLGNKTADFFGLANSSVDSLERATAYDAVMHANDADWQRANEAGSKALKHLTEHPEYDFGTVGSVSQFFAAAIAFEELGRPPMEEAMYSPAKTPSLWGYGPKREVGVFSDALLKGFPPGAAGLPLFIGNYTFELFEKNMHKYEEAEKQFEKLLPPSYPYTVDLDLAERGKLVFSNNCIECHGSHRRDDQGVPIFERPTFVGIDDVATDSVRATVITDEVWENLSDAGLANYLQKNEREPGYIAPNLWGVWARFPYLHNGSVANMADLLTAPSQRPKYIDLRGIGEEHRFDRDRLGATPTDADAVRQRVINADRWVFNSERRGFGNGGHEFGIDLSDEDKSALIEYLKTL